MKCIKFMKFMKIIIKQNFLLLSKYFLSLINYNNDIHVKIYDILRVGMSADTI